MPIKRSGREKSSSKEKGNEKAVTATVVIIPVVVIALVVAEPMGLLITSRIAGGIMGGMATPGIGVGISWHCPQSAEQV